MTHRRIVALVILTALLVLPVSLPASAAPQAKTYIVNSNAETVDANPGNGTCDVDLATPGDQCTLHAAIEEANQDGVPSTIKFASPMDISIQKYKLVADDYTTIDASDQWNGAWPHGRPGVRLIYNGTGYATLLHIGANHCAVRGIEFSGGSNSTGMRIDGGLLDVNGNVIGGAGTGQRNVFVGLAKGIHLEDADYSTVASNYVGTWDGLNADGNGTGIYVFDAAYNVVEDNLISGNTEYGIHYVGGVGNTIRDNIIGANRALNGPLPNGIGVNLGGWAILGPGNFIAGNSGHGVYMHGWNTTVKDNTIGYAGFNLGNGGNGINMAGDPAVSIIPWRNRITGNTISSNGGHGMRLLATDEITITGNTVTDNTLDGIYLEMYTGPGPAWSNSLTQVGGGGTGEGNVISSNGGNGIRLSGAVTATVAGNTIGLDAAGTANLGNQGYGILVENGTRSSVIGGVGPGEGNWIAHNHKTGIHLDGNTTRNNYVIGNVIGAPVNWSAPAPNGWHGVGVYGGAHDNWIGTLDGPNTILSSGWSGVAIVNSNDNTVMGSFIGTDGAGVNWGNAYYGVNVVNGSGNEITLSEIAYNGTNNGEAGIRVDGAGATGNPISQNSIHDNGGKGIELVNGGNNNLPAPTISQADCHGPVAGQACANCAVEIFSDSADEGRVYEGAVIADPSGAFGWDGTPSGPNVTATARDPADNTSPFSAAFPVGSCNTPPKASFTVNPASGYTTTIFSFNASTCSDNDDPPAALKVRWDWENDGAYDTAWSTTKTATHSYATLGVHTVRLQVQDTGGLTDATTRQVTVSAQPTTTGHKIFLPLVGRNFP